MYFTFRISRLSDYCISFIISLFIHFISILILTPHTTTRQARVLAHLEGLMTFSPNLVGAAGGQFDDVDEEEEEGATAVAAADGEGEQAGAGAEGGEGGRGMNGHNGTVQ